jgi:hypothetical protein
VDSKSNKSSKPNKPAKPQPRRRSNTGGYWLLVGLFFVLVGAIVGLFLAFQNIE